MLEIAAIVSPVFLVVLVGFAGAKMAMIQNDHVDGLLHFLTHFAVPALLFNSVAQLDLAATLDPLLIVAYYVPCTMIFAIGIISARQIFGQRPGESVASAFTAVFANSVFLGLPIAERAYGEEGTAFALAIVSIHAPILYLLGVVAMEMAARDGAGFRAGVSKVVNTLGKNPMLVSVAAGIAFNVTGLTMPGPVSEGLATLGKAALPVGMFAIGATLARYSLGGQMKTTIFFVVLAIVIRPALTAVAAFLVFRLDPLPAKIAVLIAAMPGGVNIYLFAALYQRSMMLAANALLIGTAAGIVTVTAWLAWLGQRAGGGEAGSGPLVLRRAHHDIGGDRVHLRQRAEHLGVEMLVGGEIRDLDPQQIFDGAGDVVALPNLRRGGDRALERLLRCLGMIGEPDGDIGGEALAERRAIQHRAIPRDHTAALQFLHPAQAGGGRKPDPRRQIGIADPAIALQFPQYPVVDGVNLRHVLQNIPPSHKNDNPVASILQQTCAMTQDILGGLAAFALVSSLTPGPNNLMLMASGANFGLRRTVPHMLGIAIGFTIMIVLVGLGLAQVFDAFPVSYLILKALSVAFLIWLAWKLANAAPPDPEAAEGRPLTFLQAALFQWVNPKAWAMALSAISIYAVSRTPEAILLVAAIFGIVNLPSIALWTVMGQQLRRLLSNPRRLRAFNIFMALMLLASLYPVLLSR